MIEESIRYFKYKRIIKDAKQFIYHDTYNNRMIKLDKDCVRDMNDYNSVMVTTPSIDEDQIQLLSNKQKYINYSSLPEGIVYYKYLPVGIIYPKYFEGYKTFEELYKEDAELFFYNLKKAYYNNLELVHNNIFNKDFAFKNIMYNGTSIELVDLDGKLIGNSNNTTYDYMYSYYIHDLYKALKKKIEILYPEDSDKVLSEINNLFQNRIPNEVNYPLEVINKIEKKRILK